MSVQFVHEYLKRDVGGQFIRGVLWLSRHFSETNTRFTPCRAKYPSPSGASRCGSIAAAMSSVTREKPKSRHTVLGTSTGAMPYDSPTTVRIQEFVWQVEWKGAPAAWEFQSTAIRAYKRLAKIIG